DGVSQAMPEFFGFAIKSGAAADHGPELPSELAAQIAKRPPAPQKMLAGGCGVTRGKFRVLTGRSLAGTQASETSVEVAFDLLLQRLDHARDGHQHGDAFAADSCHDVRWIERVLEHDGAAQQWGKENSQKLS